MKTDNRGFTLTELIVSIAIFAIVAAAAYGFMVAGANSYAGVSDNLGRQLRGQMAFSQIENRLVDCDAAVYAVDSKLYVVSKNATDNAKYDVCVYELKYDHILYFGKLDAQSPELTNGKLTASSLAKLTSLTADKVLAQKVASFSASVPDAGKMTVDTIARACSMQVTLVLQTRTGANGATDTQTVALRNKPQLLS